MRRLAKQSRKDTYSSNRDYQAVHDRRGQRIRPQTSGACHVVFKVDVEGDAAGLVCWGGYALTKTSTTLNATLKFRSGIEAVQIKLDHGWRRIGAILDNQPEAGEAVLVLEWDGSTPLELWGLGIGRPQVPSREASAADLQLLRQSHLIPETFYLAHNSAVDVEVAAEASSRLHLEEGSPVKLKKCSYCGRLLPVDPKRLGALAFHKHNAKVSKHQNECRACKKWRINDSFNPLRTTDQLHESSVITRERKLFLREPEILQKLKDRTGAGLKSKVWERFDRRCFRCNKPVALDDFQLDHTRPLAYLWPIDEHATCLCSECNNEKKEKFPIDFYTPHQLQKLSEVTGLALSELKRKELNQRELRRILDDLPTFARDWDPRTFVATARKIKELRSDIDLLDRLRIADSQEFNRLEAELRDRPPPVDEE